MIVFVCLSVDLMSTFWVRGGKGGGGEEGRRGEGEKGRTGSTCIAANTLLSSSFDPREVCKIFWKL